MNILVDPANSENSFEDDLNLLQIQLRSQRASDILRGMNLARKLINENPDDRRTYEKLLDTVEENRAVRDQVRNLLIELMQRGDKIASQTLSLLPSNEKELLTDADDAYYAAEYDRAIQLYLRYLKLVPDNERALKHLENAKSAQAKPDNQVAGISRDTIQYYRRARSYVAAGDYSLALKALNAAVESAQVRGEDYSDAEGLLRIVEDSMTALECKKKAERAVEKNEWADAVEFINKGLSLILADEFVKKELDELLNVTKTGFDLHERGALKIFAPISKKTNVLKTAKRSVNERNPIIHIVENQLREIKVIRTIFIVLFLLVILTITFFSSFINYISNDDFSEITETVIPTIFVTKTPIPITYTVTLEPIIPTGTPLPSPTALIILGYGKMTEYTFPYDMPNGNILGIQLRPKEYVTIIDSQTVKNVNWYKCRWSREDTLQEGWIPEKFIQFAIPPTSTP